MNNRIISMNDREFEFYTKLFRSPELFSRINEILDIAQNTQGIVKAEDAETRVTEEIRKLGFEVMQGWANSQSARVCQEAANNKQLKKHSKKNSIGILPTDL